MRLCGSGVRVLVGLALLLLAGCVKIQVASETPERRTEAADLRGKDWRATFAENLRRGTPIQQVEMTKRMMDTICASYFKYGTQVSDQWQQANTGRGSEVSAAEMSTVVSKWNETQQPLLQAYEESIEYGIDQIKQSQQISPQIIGELDKYRDHFYAVYNAVFFPKGTVSEYGNVLEELRGKGDRLSRLLDQLIDQAR